MTRRSYFIAILLAAGVVSLALGIKTLFPRTLSTGALADSLFVVGVPAVPVTGAQTAAGPLAPPRTPPAGSLEYRSAEYRFSLFYPDTLSVKSYDEGGGASTIVFQNPQEAEGLQVFIVPYSALQVNEARFAEDEPSGVRQDVTNMSVDGAVAAAFYGQSTALGPTREIWFIHGGFLYEVTAPQSLAGWLDTIMATWEFI